MQVEDALPGIRADIRQETVATSLDAQLTSYSGPSSEEAGEYRPILWRQGGHIPDMAPGYEQDVVRRLGIDVLKRDDILVLVHNLTGYLTGCNLAEQAVFLHTIKTSMYFLQGC